MIEFALGMLISVAIGLGVGVVVIVLRVWCELNEYYDRTGGPDATSYRD